MKDFLIRQKSVFKNWLTTQNEEACIFKVSLKHTDLTEGGKCLREFEIENISWAQIFQLEQNPKRII